MARYIDSEPLEKFYQDTLDDISGMKEYEECAEYCKKALDNLKEQPTIEAIPKAQYEARLKADMVAMLTEIQLEIEEYIREFGGSYSRGYNTALLTVEQNIIQQKIDKLKAESEDT